MSDPHSHHEKFAPRRIFLAGLVTVIPLWITWLVISFLFNTLSELGRPVVGWLAKLLEPNFPQIGRIVASPIAWNVCSFLLVIALIYGLGLLTMIVAGRKLVAFFEALLERLPLIRHVYRSVKKLTTVLQEKPAGDVQRVVLIEFPTPEMKTVGLVTRVLEDVNTGRKLAAVYVPTTPNPTSGYLEVVPVERLTQTDWTMDEAMNFIVSGGAIAPDNIVYDAKIPEPNSGKPAPERDIDVAVDAADGSDDQPRD